MKGVILSKSRIRESFFLQAVAERRHQMDPPENSPRSMLEAIGKGVEGCMSTWRGVSLSAVPTSRSVSTYR
jgi:hypothetical protein